MIKKKSNLHTVKSMIIDFKEKKILKWLLKSKRMKFVLVEFKLKNQTSQLFACHLILISQVKGYK